MKSNNRASIEAAVGERTRNSPAAVILPDGAHRTPKAIVLPVTSHNGTAHVATQRRSWGRKMAQGVEHRPSSDGKMALETCVDGPALAGSCRQPRDGGPATAGPRAQSVTGRPATQGSGPQVAPRIPQGEDRSGAAAPLVRHVRVDLCTSEVDVLRMQDGSGTRRLDFRASCPKRALSSMTDPPAGARRRGRIGRISP